MAMRSGDGDPRKAPRLGPIVEALEGRRLLSITPLIYFGPTRNGLLPPGAVAAAQVAQPSQAAPATLTPTRREQALEFFNASFYGNYQASPARFLEQHQQFFFAGGGLSNAFLHGDIEMAVYTPADPALAATGSLSMIGKNVSNTGNLVGMDVVADPASRDAHGRPTRFTWTVNGNSGGSFAGAEGSGTMRIIYKPPFRNLGTDFEAGRFCVIFSGHIQTSRVSSTLRYT